MNLSSGVAVLQLLLLVSSCRCYSVVAILQLCTAAILGKVQEMVLQLSSCATKGGLQHGLLLRAAMLILVPLQH